MKCQVCGPGKKVLNATETQPSALDTLTKLITAHSSFHSPRLCRATNTILKIREQSARERFAQYAYKQNEHLRGVSKTAAARIAKEEKANMGALQNEMFNHRRRLSGVPC